MAQSKRSLLEQIAHDLRALLSLFPTRFRIRFGRPEPRDNLPQGNTHMTQKTITDIDHVAATLDLLDAAGNPLSFDQFPTPPLWRSSDETIVTVSQNADGSNVDIETTGKLGTVQITAKGTTAAGVEINGIGDLEVVTSGPATFRINFGTASPK